VVRFRHLESNSQRLSSAPGSLGRQEWSGGPRLESLQQKKFSVRRRLKKVVHPVRPNREPYGMQCLSIGLAGLNVHSSDRTHGPKRPILYLRNRAASQSMKSSHALDLTRDKRARKHVHLQIENVYGLMKLRCGYAKLPQVRKSRNTMSSPERSRRTYSRADVWTPLQSLVVLYQQHRC